MIKLSQNKKIRIVSFQNAHNFGAVCQAYGLQQTLLELGYMDVLFINYNPQYLKDRYNPLKTWQYLNLNTSIFHKISRIMRWCSFAITTWMRNRRIEQSIKRMLRQTSNELMSSKEVAEEEVDILICGSDQIWNTALTGSLDPVFFGQAKTEGYEKLISYAPSTEISALNEDTIRQMAECLKSFSAISVREDSFRNKLKPFVSKSIEVTVDPTLLCGRVAFDQIASERLERKPYICIYAYNQDEKLVRDVLQTIPDYLSYEVHYLMFAATNITQWGDSSLHSAISVEDFLSYIKHASYVITNSFHGLAFSVLYEKNFIVTWMDGKSTRCESLLRELGIGERLVKNANDVSWQTPDYQQINNTLERIREESRNFLNRNINE